MTTDSSPLMAAQPAIRDDVRLGPPLLSGVEVRHQVKDERTAQYLDIGPREHFIIERLDGHRSLAQIGDEYEQEFARRLDEARWQEILTVLAGRQLLEGTAPEDGGPPEQPDTGRSWVWNLVRYHFPLTNPDRFFDRLTGPLAFLYRRRVVATLAFLVVMTEVIILANLSALMDQSRTAFSDGSVLATAIPTLWLIVAIHEMAHGLTCKHFGGSSTAIGVMWRFPLIAPYCRVDDVLLFPRPAHRVYTAFAGVFSGLVALVPFAAVWLIVEPGSYLSRVSSLILLGGTMAALANLIPFFQLDGYHMLNHSLNMLDLRSASSRYLRERIAVVRGRSPMAHRYPARLARIYLAYSLGQVLFGVVAFCGFMLYLYVAFAEPAAGQAAVGLVAGIAVLCLLTALAIRLLMDRDRRRMATNSANPTTNEEASV